MPGPRFVFVKLLASSGSHCTKWADEQHWPAGFESRLVPDIPLPFIPTLIGLWAFDLVSSPVWWEAATNSPRERSRAFVCGLSSPVLGLHSVDRLTSGPFCRVCLGTGDFLRPQGAIPPGLYPLWGFGFIAWRPKRGMPTVPKVFLALPDACGLRPCDRAHLKNGLVPYSCVGGTLR